MIKSMTGFGQAIHSTGTFDASVEIKSLNSKFLDLSLRLPRMFADKESELRNLIAEKIERGKVSLSIDYQSVGKTDLRQSYNYELFSAYYAELKKLADAVGAPSHDPIFDIALHSPDVIETKVREEIDPADWAEINVLLREAFEKFDEFRTAEGNVLEEKIGQYIDSIRTALLEIEKLDPLRIEKIRARIKGNVIDFFGSEGFDANRLEQEIIFYIERLDIHEERVRLKAHLDYFVQAMRASQSNGKKLAFIAQEIGREINTIGSKANDAPMQQHVVAMKEELEKIKEQLNNVI